MNYLRSIFKNKKPISSIFLALSLVTIIVSTLGYKMDFIKIDLTRLQSYFLNNTELVILLILNTLPLLYLLRFILLRLNKAKYNQEIRTASKRLDIKYKSDNPKLYIHDYQGICDMELEIPYKAKWIFLTGENGFGKTNILQAIARAFGNDDDNRNYNGIRPLSKQAKIRLESKNISRTLELDIYKGFDEENFDFKILGYGVGRLMMGSERSSKVYKSASGLFDNDIKHRNIEKEGLSRWFFNRRKSFNEFESMIKELIPSLDKIEVDDENNVWYFEKDDENQVLPKVMFNDLASGYQSIISMIGDIYLNIESFKKSNRSNFKLLILIDELELYLHPKWQKQFPNVLSRIFPDALFIASTHSPIPLLGAPKNSIIHKVKRTKREGITLKRLDKLVMFDRILPNALLNSPIFGMEDITPSSKYEMANLLLEDDFSEAALYYKLEDDIDAFLTNKKEKELIDLFKKK